jgi:hypothetical protein
MKSLFLLGVCFAYAQTILGQDCSCTAHYSWLKKTIEENDAGFKYAIEKKGEDEYKKHSAVYAERVKTITDKAKCADELLSWLRFFRKGHLWIGLNNDENNAGDRKPDTAKTRAQYKGWPEYSYNEKEFKSRLAQSRQPTLEGIWTSTGYTFGIAKENNGYTGFVIDAANSHWSRGQVKFKIKDSAGTKVAAYYMLDHTAKYIDDVQVAGDNYVMMDFVTLRRIFPVVVSDKALDLYFKFASTSEPLFEKLSDKTVILRIPSFNSSMKKMIDSVIAVNHKIITSTENLIIDLRYNGGGSDESFERILPLIYTNPVRVIGMEFLSTPINNERMLAFSKDPGWSESDRKWAAQAFIKLNSNLGKFVNLDSGYVDLIKYDKIYKYPKNVGLIINEGNGSTTEQFLLAAKQSKKVKLFGTSTAGVLDISNMHFINAPCNDLKLGYSLSRTLRIPDFTIDDKGIQPDYYIDRSIPKYEWINFVDQVLKERR